MQFFRKSLLVILTPILVGLLFATAFEVGVFRIIGHPEQVKKIIKDSGVYNTVVPAALEQAKSVSSDSGDLPLTNSAVQNAAVSTFTPQTIQNYTNQAIDGVYNWLDGKTPQPDFAIDLSSLKTTFAAQVGKAATVQAAALPACTSQAEVESFNNVFEATCLPPGVTPAQAGANASNAILSGQGFLDHPVITANNVKGSNSNQSVFATDQLKNAPKAYHRAKQAPYILALLALLVTGGIVLLSSSWQRGLRHAGFIFLGVGIFMLLFSYSLNYGVTKQALPKIKLDNAVLTNDVKSLLTDIVQAVDKNYWIFGGVYTVLGAAAVIVPSFINRNGKPEKVVADSSNSVTGDKPKPVQEKPAAKKPPKLVQ